MASEVGICNSALRHLRAGSINSLDERSVNGEYCRDAYPELRDVVLQVFEWSFATRSRALSLLDAVEIVNWKYVYQLPNDSLKIQEVFLDEGDIKSTPSSHFKHDLHYRQNRDRFRIEYEIQTLNDNKVLVSNTPDLYCRYTEHVTDPNQMPDSFRKALSYLIASELAIAIIGVDRGFRLTEAYYTMYQNYLRDAQVQDVNQSRQTSQESELVTTREGYGFD